MCDERKETVVADKLRYDPFVPSNFEGDWDSLSIVCETNMNVQAGHPSYRKRRSRELLRPVILDSSVAFRSVVHVCARWKI